MSDFSAMPCHHARTRRCGIAWLLPGGAAAGVLLAGCVGPAVPRRGGPDAEVGPAEARAVSFHGWRECYRLSNGLVSVTCVPQVGGRTLDYSLGPYNFLFLGHAELGATLDDDDGGRYRYFGGHFAQLWPEARWRTIQSTFPPDLYMGRYTARLAPATGGAAAVEMSSPVDLATGTCLARKVELFPGSTRLRLTDTLTNVRRVPQEWGIHDMLQLKGAATRSGVLRGSEKPDGRLALYVPLNPQSRFPDGVRHLTREGSAARAPGGQWTTSDLPGILVVRYRRQLGKAHVDPVLPWLAFVDHGSGYVFVQRCQAPEKAILTAGGPLDDYPFIEVQCFGPGVRLAPGKSTSLVQEWFAARCSGPVVDVTDVGVVASPLSLLRGEGKTWVAGTFGVFYVARAVLAIRDADGGELARLDCGAVGPLRPLALNRAIDLPPRTAQVSLELSDPTGKPLGHLGKILLGTR